MEAKRSFAQKFSPAFFERRWGQDQCLAPRAAPLAGLGGAQHSKVVFVNSTPKSRTRPYFSLRVKESTALELHVQGISFTEAVKSGLELFVTGVFVAVLVLKGVI